MEGRFLSTAPSADGNSQPADTSRTEALSLSRFPLHQQSVPTDRVRFTDGTTSDYKPPFLTVDPRAIACTEHRVGCDCREAWLREDILEWKIEYQILKQAADDIVGDHEQETCMCSGCQILRHTGTVSKRMIAQARARLESVQP